MSGFTHDQRRPVRRGPRRSPQHPSPALLVLVRLGQLGLRHHHRDGPVLPLPDLRGQGGRVPEPRRRRGLSHQPGRPRHPGLPRVPGPLHPDPLDHRVRARAGLRRRDRRPVRPAHPALRRLRLGRRGRDLGDVPRDRHQLAARRAAADRRQPVPGWVAGHLRLAAVPDRRAGRARPGLQPRVGPGVPRRRPAARAEPGPGHAARPGRPVRGGGGAGQPALGRPVVGRVHRHPRARPARPAGHDSRPGRRPRRRGPRQPAPSWPGRSPSCAATPRRCCSCWPTCSTTTASRP